jgi:hypothetical protein
MAQVMVAEVPPSVAVAPGTAVAVAVAPGILRLPTLARELAVVVARAATVPARARAWVLGPERVSEPEPGRGALFSAHQAHAPIYASRRE